MYTFFYRNTWQDMGVAWKPQKCTSKFSNRSSIGFERLQEFFVKIRTEGAFFEMVYALKSNHK